MQDCKDAITESDSGSSSGGSNGDSSGGAGRRGTGVNECAGFMLALLLAKTVLRYCYRL